MPVFQLQNHQVSAPQTGTSTAVAANLYKNMSNPFDKLGTLNGIWTASKDSQIVAEMKPKLQQALEAGRSLGESEQDLLAMGYTPRDLANLKTSEFYKDYLANVDTRDTNARAWGQLDLLRSADKRAWSTHNNVTLPAARRDQVKFENEQQDRVDERAVEAAYANLIRYKAEHGDVGYQGEVEAILGNLPNIRQKTLLLNKLGLTPDSWNPSSVEVAPVQPVYQPKVVVNKDGTTSYVADTSAPIDPNTIVGESTLLNQIDREINKSNVGGYLYDYDAEGNLKWKNLDIIQWAAERAKVDPSWVGKTDPKAIENKVKDIIDRLKNDPRVSKLVTPELAAQMILGKSRVGFWGGANLSEAGYNSIIQELLSSQENLENIRTLSALRKGITGANSMQAINKLYTDEIARIEADKRVSEDKKVKDRARAAAKRNKAIATTVTYYNQLAPLIQRSLLEGAETNYTYTDKQAELKEKAQKAAQESLKKAAEIQADILGAGYYYDTPPDWKPTNDWITPLVRRLLGSATSEKSTE